MNTLYHKIRYIVYFLKLTPHLILFNYHHNNSIIHFETKRWLDLMQINFSLKKGFIYLMMNNLEFRNLFYFRVGGFSKYIHFLCPKMNTLFINTEKIGKGMFIQHGFSTIIAANSIGENCFINQQVTIGFSDYYDCPTILNNVVIRAGAKIFGQITIGNNSVVGANSVVTKSVPDNCTVVGIPAYIIKRNGVKVHEVL